MNEYQVFSCHMSVRVNILITPYWVQIGSNNWVDNKI